MLIVQVGFNVELGGYFSGKRNTMSIDGDTFVARDQVVAYCEALLKVFRCAQPTLAAGSLASCKAPWLPVSRLGFAAICTQQRRHLIGQ